MPDTPAAFFKAAFFSSATWQSWQTQHEGGWKNNGLMHVRSVSSESFLRALKYVVEEGKSFGYVVKKRPLMWMWGEMKKFQVSRENRINVLRSTGPTDFKFTHYSDDDDSDDDVRFENRSRTSSSHHHPHGLLDALCLTVPGPARTAPCLATSTHPSCSRPFIKKWKQGPSAGIFSAQPSLSMLQLEPCLIGIVLDHLDYVAFARMAVFVCKFLETMARAMPELQTNMT